ncbi:MAG: hypothetical protein CL534_09030 [Ahrensia sp.]|nr:hypothetical protein [Ahrensia sp.]
MNDERRKRLGQIVLKIQMMRFKFDNILVDDEWDFVGRPYSIENGKRGERLQIGSHPMGAFAETLHEKMSLELGACE